MILPVLDCKTDTVTIFEQVQKGMVKALRIVTVEELRERGLRTYGLESPAACGMFPDTEETYPWR